MTFGFARKSIFAFAFFGTATFILADEAVATTSLEEGKVAFSEGNYKAAMRAFSTGMRDGDVKATYYLARMLELGLGVDADVAAAIRLYRQAANDGDVEAINRVALMHYRGETGIEQDSAADNNYLFHHEASLREELREILESDECKAEGSCADVRDKFIALNSLDQSRDDALRWACRDWGSQACMRQTLHIQAAFKSYVQARETGAFDDRTWGEYLQTGRDYGEYRSTIASYGALRALEAMPVDAVSGTVDLAVLSAKAAAGDPDAREQLAYIAAGISAFVQDPIGVTEQGIKEQLAEADRLEAEGNLIAADEIRASVVLGGVFAVSPLASGTVFTGVKLVNKLRVSASNRADPFLDSTTAAGDGVYHNAMSTAIGDDLATMRNFTNAIDTGNGHNVIVHGRLDYDDLGGVPTVNGRETNPAQIAEAVRSNPNYVEGSQVCFASCWSGSSGSAQQLANELNAPVYAPNRPVAWNSTTDSWVFDTDVFGAGNVPRTDIQAGWQTFYPTGN